MTKVLFSEPDQLLHYDWKDIKRKISFHALRRGKPGRILNTFITGKDHKVQLPNDPTNEEYLKDKENLMADILDVIPSSILEKLEDKLDTYIVQADVLGLWKDLNELYEADKEEVYKRFYRRTKRNAFAVLISTLTGEYIERSWTTITESEDLRNDVVSLNGSVALVSALVLTIVLPMFLEAAQSTDNDLEIAYCFFCAMATMLESISVLLTVRNLIAMSLLNIDDIKIYVTKATWVMMAPLKLHIYAVMILLAALVVFAFNVIDANLVIGFLCIFLIPALTYYLVSSSYSAKYVLDLKDEDVHFKLPLNHLPHINKSNVNNSNNNEHHQAKIYPTTEKETNNN